jgi:hypothetical protein
MLVRGVGIRDIGIILEISITTVLKVLKSTKYQIKPKQTHYDCLETDKFWTYVGEKKNKVWLIYAYHRESGEIAAFVCMGETGSGNGAKAEEEDKTVGDKL